MRNLLFCLTLAAALLFPYGFAAAQVQIQGPQCNDRDIVLGLLAEKYSEVPVALGIANNGALIEVLTDEKGFTFSIIITTAKGMSCLVAAGEGWRNMDRNGIAFPHQDPEA